MTAEKPEEAPLVLGPSYLNAMRNVVNYEYRPAVLMAREGHLEAEHFHLPPRLGPSFFSIDGFAGRTL